MRFRLLLLGGALVAPLALASAALAGNGGFAPVPPQSPNADGITQSFLFISAFCLAILLLVEGLLIAFVIRYRRRKRPRFEEAAQVHGATRLELAWTLGPVLVLFAIVAFVFWKLPGIQDVPSASAGGSDMVVRVTGTQFTWEFRYPNGVVTIDRLRAPVGRTVELDVTSPDWDVIHSWWVPALGGKIDAIPGRINKTWFKATTTGVFQGQCAELCGLYHAKMLDTVEVMPAAEFDAWLSQRADQQAAGTSPLGQELWEGSCAKCHGASGEGAYGPKIAGSTLIEDKNQVERLLRNGFGKMPPVGREWNQSEMDAITSYLSENLGS